MELPLKPAEAYYY